MRLCQAPRPAEALSRISFGRSSDLPLSLALVPPALLGIWTGFQIQDRIDQALFKRLTLWILLLAGLNLLRRGIIAL